MASMKKLHALLPDAIPKPYATGKLSTMPQMSDYFFVADFKRFNDRLSHTPAEVAALVARLHKRAFSGSSMFGSDMAVYDGCFHIQPGWHKDWSQCFSRIISAAYRHDLMTNGTWPELTELFECVKQVIIPRLLGSLKFDGRPIEACFIHGDLWEENFGTEESTGRLFMFDSNGYYAHHEMDLAMWVTKHHEMHKYGLLVEYLNHMPATEPVEEFDDRLALYSIKAYLMYSAHCRNHPTRQ